MMLLDVNVLLYAYREDAPQHPQFKAWLDSLVNGNSPYALSDFVLSGFLRIVTHAKIFRPPTPMKEALRAPVLSATSKIVRK